MVSPDTTTHVLAQKLSDSGLRATPQREVVFNTLLNKRDHPTADEVYARVRHDMPTISLATVYKSLETLVGCGLAAKLTYGDGSARYDGRTDPHPHARCLVCDAVLDVPGRLDGALMAQIGTVPGFAVEGFRLEIIGHCEECTH